MSSQEEIEVQQKRLITYRRTLTHYLQQKAYLVALRFHRGSPMESMTHRRKFARSKIPCDLGVFQVDDHPDDDRDSSVSIATPHPNIKLSTSGQLPLQSSRQSQSDIDLMKDRFRIIAVVAIIIAFVSFLTGVSGSIVSMNIRPENQVYLWLLWPLFISFFLIFIGMVATPNYCNLRPQNFSCERQESRKEF